jgi:Holliday junction resolvase RusA-like endonuclease
MITVWIPGDPPTATAQQKGQNRKTGKYYKPPDLRDAEQKYMAYAAQARPPQPITGPVQLHVVFMFDHRSRHADGEPKTTKPDTDNMVKLLKDVLTRCGFWKDDAQVYDERVMKVWSSQPKTVVMVEEMCDEQTR